MRLPMNANEGLRKKVIFSIAVVSIIAWQAAIANRAYGQGSTWAGANLQQRLQEARWRLGSLRVNAAFSLGQVGYDSDIYSGFFTEAVPDFSFSASVPIQALLPLKKQIVIEVFDSPQYVYYLETVNERTWNNLFRGQVHFALDRFYVQAGGSLSNIRLRMSDELLVNVRQREDSLNGSILWQVSEETSLALLYGGQQYRYGDPGTGAEHIVAALSRNVQSIDFVTYLQPNARFRYFLDGQFAGYDFTEPSSAFKDARSYGIFGGFELAPRVGELLQAAGVGGSIRLGYMRVNMNDPQRLDGSALVGRINLSLKLLKKTEGRVVYSRGYQFSGYSGATFYLVSSLGGGVSERVSRRTTISYDILLSGHSYPAENVETGNIPSDFYGRYTAHIFKIDIRLAQNLGIGFSGTLARRKRVESGQFRDVGTCSLHLVYGAATGMIPSPVGSLLR